MAETNISKSNPIVAKLYGTAIFKGMEKQAGFFRKMVGKRPTEKEAIEKIGKLQTAPGMPIVEIMDLAQTAGQKVGMDCIDASTGKPIMGDRDAEGKGTPISFSHMEMGIDQWTFGVDAGGKMSQQRTETNLRNLAKAQAMGKAAKFFDQRTLVHLAGARGDNNSADWVVPLASDPDFAEIMVNPVQAPSYNRHLVIDGTSFVQGGQQLANVDTTDSLKLSHIDDLSYLIDAMEFPLQPIRIDGDESDEPIYILALTPGAYNDILTEGVLRQFQQHAIQRAQAGNIMAHPLFRGNAVMWNNIMFKKLNRWVSFNGGSTVKHIASANAATATETDVQVAGIANTHQVDRCLLLGAQALGCAYGKDSESGYHYSWGERKYNFNRAIEFAAFGIDGMAKVRFGVPDGNGVKIPTDNGVFAIDVVTKKGIRV